MRFDRLRALGLFFVVGFILVTFLNSASCSLGRAQGVVITHGPILGRPGPDHMGIWIRTSRPTKFWVRYGQSQNSLNEVAGPGQTSLEHDITGWILLKGLQPNTKYYYRVTLSPDSMGDGIHGGSFRTWPSTEQVKDPETNPRGLFNFRFEFACGNNQTPGSGLGPALPTYGTMLRNGWPERLQFAILNGDWLYEDKRDYSLHEWMQQVGITEPQLPRIVRIAPTIVGVWENYKVYLERGKNLAEWHRLVPSFFTFDDHEIINDTYGTGSPGRHDRKAAFRDIGIQAWYDYLGWSNPVEFTQPIYMGRARIESGSDVLYDSEAKFSQLDLSQAGTLMIHWGTRLAGDNSSKASREPGHPAAGVYEIVEVVDNNRLRIRPAPKVSDEVSYSIGRMSHFRVRIANAEFYFLDTRSHRQMHDVTNRWKKGLTMLGQRQKAWLKQNRAASDADMFFVVSSVNFMIPHVGGTAEGNSRANRVESNKDDAWTAFLEEREELINFWDSLGKPVFVLTGDLHNSFAIKITDRVREFASGPHNSRNHPARSEGNRPPNGPYDSFGRKCEIRWSTYIRNDVPREQHFWPVFTVVQVNNVFNNPVEKGKDRWVAYPVPHVIFQYYNGLTGELMYAEAIPVRTRGT